MGNSDITSERIRRLAAAAKESAAAQVADRESRDAAIIEGDRAGLGLRELSRISGLSVSHVQRIVTHATARRQAGVLA